MLKLTTALFAVLLYFYAHPQDNYRFISYTVNEGLPQSSIDDIIQDKDGFLWVGTAGGLCRFDGYNFKVYKHNTKDASSINSDRGYHFFVDKSGLLWIVSYHGISIYNSGKDNFTNLLVYEPATVVTSENHFYGEDDQFIWVGMNNYGMVRVDKQTHHIDKVNIPGMRPQNEHTSWYRGFLEKGKLWIVSKNDFIIYDIKSKAVQKINIPIVGITNINDSLAVGMNPKFAVLVNKKNFTYRPISITTDGSEPNINSIYKASDSIALLCSTTRGLFYLNIFTHIITKHISHADAGDNKKYLSAACAFTDHSGNLWVGSSGDGVREIPYRFKKFNTYRSDTSKTNSINSIYADSNNIYVSSSRNGMDIFSKTSGFKKNIPFNKQLHSIINTATITSLINKDKLLLIGYSSQTNGHNTPFTYSLSTGRLELLNNEVQKIFTDHWGQGNFRQFAFRYNDSTLLTNVGEYLVALKSRKNGELFSELFHRFPGEMLSCCFLDRMNRLWMGSYKGAFVLLNGEWRKIDLPRPIEIKTINQDYDGNMWLGTGNGIYILNNNLQVIESYTEENNLLNEHVYGILRDDDGNMWFSHNKGLSVYKWKEKKFRHYTNNDGLQSSEFNSSAYFKAPNGELFFGGIDGANSFYPREILDNPNTPPVKITSVKLFDEPYKTDASYWDLHSIELPYTDNSLSFEFALPEFNEPGKNQYAYIMENLDKTWINSGDKRFARYAGLRPGKYIFKVKASNNDGVWGNDFASISITILAPFWQRTWFIILSSLLFISLVAFVVSQVQRQRFKKKLHELEVLQKIQLERERISRDLHDNVGTQLSMINKNIKEMMSPLKAVTEAERTKRLQSAGQSSIEVIDTLRETIWALNKKEISLEEFSDKLKTFIQKQLAHYDSITLHIKEDDNNHLVKLSPTEALNLFRICQEAITNAIKYAEASVLEISLLNTDGDYCIRIADNGRGFEPGKVNSSLHYGVENMKYRAKEILCKLSLDTMPEQGTIITLSKK